MRTITNHILLLVIVSGAVTRCTAQRRISHISIAVTNSITAKPFSGFPRLFYSQYHPGFTAGASMKWQEKAKHDWSQTFKLGYFYHRYVQHAIPVYTEFGYRYKPNTNWGFSAMLGAGYLHSIPAVQRFRLNEETGEYEKIRNLGRAQGMFSLTFGADRALGHSSNRIFVRYQILLQTPFVPSYVPLLPYNQFHVGYTFPLHAKSTTGK